MPKKIVIIGSGFSSLSASCYLAKAGYEVLVLEKNSQLGGRARVFEHNLAGEKFVFDMGPSWYWMPTVFDSFLAEFGKKVEDYYNLIKLDPAFTIFFQDYKLVLPAKDKDISQLFQELEPDGCGEKKLEEFLEHAEFTFKNGISDYMQRSSLNPFEFLDLKFLKNIFKAGILQSYQTKIYQQFKNPYLQKLLEFPILFLGATPKNTPYLYSLMAYTMLKEGTFYPIGGMGEVVKMMVSLAKENGVKFQTGAKVSKIVVEQGVATGVLVMKA